MTSIDALKAVLAQQFLNRELVPFLRTGNPAHAWAAYRIARACGVPTPEWVLVYFDGCAERLQDATSNKQAAEAIGFATKGGPYSIAEQARTNARNYDIVTRFFVLKDRQTSSELKAAGAPPALLKEMIDVPESDTALMQQVGEEFGLEADSVRDIVYELIRTTKA